MFRDSDLPALVDLLVRRKVFLYHACQYGDFVSYLKLGGIPSRQCLQQEALSFTEFTTDAVDQENRVWDKVFVNWEDFGRAFARGHNAAPNAYGPIVVRIHPRALLRADDVAVCLRSAGARGFDRDRESLYSIEQVDRLFWKPADAGAGTAKLKFRNDLKAAFGVHAEAVEVSCTYPHGVLPWADALDVVVDPYVVNGASLAAYVDAAVQHYGVRMDVWYREVRHPERYQMLLAAVATRTPPIAELAQTLEDEGLRAWAREIQARGGILEKNYERWADYLRAGTLQRLRTRIAVPALYEYAPGLGDEDHDEWDEYDDYDPYEEERAQIRAEREDFYDGLQRANDDGWFYPDDDGDEDEVAVDPWD